jgi:hypothetical protein
MTSVIQLIDFGKQPVSHRFLFSREEGEYLGALKIGQCQNCGLVQQLDPMPVDELRPRFDWLTSTEPERHIDDLVQNIIRLPGITPDSKICGISWKEDTTLERLNNLGYRNTWRLKPKLDLGVGEAFADVETVQKSLTFECSEKIVQKRGRVDIVIARHIIEHAFDVREFLMAIRNLLTLRGYVVFEIPDCERSLENLDYTTIWEEHILYFTPETFKNCFSFGGFELVKFVREEYPLEDSYVGIARINEFIKPSFSHPQKLRQECERARRFAQKIEDRRRELKTYLLKYRQQCGKVAIFGAAHMCCAFINLMELKDCIDFVVDDNPNKKGMFMPGCRLPIYGSDVILNENVQLSLLTLSPASERKVIQNNREYINRGGEFKSIFPNNPMALTI